MKGTPLFTPCFARASAIQLADLPLCINSTRPREKRKFPTKKKMKQKKMKPGPSMEEIKH